MKGLILILADKVRIAMVGSAEWKDNVFQKEYRLRPIEEVEEFVKTHHHLPDVPSAAEVEKNGYELAEMDTILLQKIEELSLYVIELEKKLKEMQQGR